MTMTPNNDIDRKAAEWLVRADSGTFSAEDEASLQAWLAQDPRHFGAYIRLRAALAQVDHFGNAAQRRIAMTQAEGRPPVMQHASRRRVMLVGSIAASLLLLITGGIVWRATSFDAVYAAGIGQTKVLRLPDGSTLTLNTNSKTTVHYTLLARDLTLDHGEALFDVAKNKARPFWVYAGPSSVRAVGTSFSVTALKDRPLQVLVREGIVEIQSANNRKPVSLGAGWRAIAQPGGGFELDAEPQDEIDRDLAWRSGYIFFKRQELASAAKEFERYSPTRILVEDPVAARRTITGMYVAADPSGFAKAVATFLNLEVRISGDNIRLVHKAKKEAPASR